jgi:hypothetical protein
MRRRGYPEGVLESSLSVWISSKTILQRLPTKNRATANPPITQFETADLVWPD